MVLPSSILLNNTTTYNSRSISHCVVFLVGTLLPSIMGLSFEETKAKEFNMEAAMSAFTFSEELQNKLRKAKWFNNGNDKEANLVGRKKHMVSYLFELVYDLVLGESEHILSEAPGFEAPLDYQRWKKNVKRLQKAICKKQ